MTVGIHCGTSNQALECAAMGFQMITISTDTGCSPLLRQIVLPKYAKGSRLHLEGESPPDPAVRQRFPRIRHPSTIYGPMR
jgi:hypothetical protein